MKAPIWSLLLFCGCAASPGPGDPPTALTPTAVAPRGDPAPAVPLQTAQRSLSELTLERALELTFEQHPRLALVRAEVGAAQAREGGAGKWDNPRLITGFESAPFEGDSFDQAEFLLGFSQTIPLSGRRSREREVRSLEREGAAQRALAELLAVRRQVAGAFATALYAQAVEALFLELEQATAQGVELLEVRIEAGDAIAPDRLAAGMTHARARRDRLRAVALALRARAELATAMGDPRCAVDSVAGDLGQSLELPTIAVLLQRLDEHPELLASHSRTLAAEARVEFAEALRVPDLQLDLLYRREGATDTDAFDLVIGVPLPLFNSGRSSVEEARQLRARAHAAERLTRDAAESELRLAHLTATRALAELAFQEREVLPRATELLEVARLQYELGDTSLLEALVARRQWIEAQLQILETQRDVMQAWAVLGPYLQAVPQ